MDLLIRHGRIVTMDAERRDPDRRRDRDREGPHRRDRPGPRARRRRGGYRGSNDRRTRRPRPPWLRRRPRPHGERAPARLHAQGRPRLERDRQRVLRPERARRRLRRHPPLRDGDDPERDDDVLRHGLVAEPRADGPGDRAGRHPRHPGPPDLRRPRRAGHGAPRHLDRGGTRPHRAPGRRPTRSRAPAASGAPSRSRAWAFRPTACSKLAHDLAARAGVPMVMHQSWGAGEVKASLEQFGKRPLFHLEDLGILGPNLTLDPHDPAGRRRGRPRRADGHARRPLPERLVPARQGRDPRGEVSGAGRGRRHPGARLRRHGRQARHGAPDAPRGHGPARGPRPVPDLHRRAGPRDGDARGRPGAQPGGRDRQPRGRQAGRPRHPHGRSAGGPSALGRPRRQPRLLRPDRDGGHGAGRRRGRARGRALHPLRCIGRLPDDRCRSRAFREPPRSTGRSPTWPIVD